MPISAAAQRHLGEDNSRQLLTMMCRIALVMFVTETIIMAGLTHYNVPSPALENLIDATTLTLASTPIIYFWIVRPFVTAAREANLALADQLDESRRLLDENEHLNASLQDANRDIADSHERLLQKIGAELHDGPAQQLTYVRLQLNRLAPFVAAARAQGVNVDVARIEKILSDTVQEVRSISTGLSLPELAAASIDDAIALSVRHHQNMGGAKVAITCSDTPHDPPLALKICVYRVVQEALTNARKHSRSSKLSVTAVGSRMFVLAIRDDGCGFEQTGAVASGLGLTGMRARVHALGGDFAVRSAPGHGTVVTATFDTRRRPR